jgi:hypothetical protein
MAISHFTVISPVQPGRIKSMIAVSREIQPGPVSREATKLKHCIQPMSADSGILGIIAMFPEKQNHWILR